MTCWPVAACPMTWTSKPAAPACIAAWCRSIRCGREADAGPPVAATNAPSDSRPRQTSSLHGHRSRSSPFRRRRTLQNPVEVPPPAPPSTVGTTPPESRPPSPEPPANRLDCSAAEPRDAEPDHPQTKQKGNRNH
ncbi:hypothetical protein GQ55_9G317400 [Panicum hallii var. hallii]|uniref:Uncharacterized protein n=1 Tax=Panicum hallii var. hallii TaxID=1504633 RepID=A0A2T7C837_9POAL|nr:hypothetical protein GQ55_9G317400 [Panicum hallii var. hallii]